MNGQFFIDVPRSGLDNMSIDQAMLEQTAVDFIPRMRVYQWLEPTVSLGYFQKFSDFQNFPSTHGLPVVRRATGGGAIVHHFDWTYSIALPAAEVGASAHGASARLYDCVHQAVVEWLRQSRLDAELWAAKAQENVPSCTTNGCSFLCFERRHAGDVVCGSPKVMGSAQRRLAGAILQHGSLLLGTSPFASNLAGLAEIGWQGEFDPSGFSERLRRAILAEFAIEFFCFDWLKAILPISEIITSKFDSSCWTARI